jgi:hypothetical protein
MRRHVVVTLLLMIVLSGCAMHRATAASPPASPSPTSCSPPAGGRCAADVRWPGPIHVSADDRRLHGVIGCGGTLHATETSDKVTITLHVGALGPGMMSCAMVDVGVRLAQPLGHRTVVDGVSGHVVRVASAARHG